MKKNDAEFSIGEIADLAGVSRRTIRFYVQSELLPPPNGVARGARYSREHLQRLFDIASLQNDGLTLEGIKKHLEGPKCSETAPELSTIEAWTRVHLSQGVELHLNPGRSDLSTSEMRQLAEVVQKVIAEIKGGNGDEK